LKFVELEKLLELLALLSKLRAFHHIVRYMKVDKLALLL
jgi:hypothetical protein